MDKDDVEHIYNGILIPAIESNWVIWVICRDMNGPEDGCTECNKSEREKQIY